MADVVMVSPESCTAVQGEGSYRCKGGRAFGGK